MGLPAAWMMALGMTVLAIDLPAPAEVVDDAALLKRAALRNALMLIDHVSENAFARHNRARHFALAPMHNSCRPCMRSHDRSQRITHPHRNGRL